MSGVRVPASKLYGYGRALRSSTEYARRMRLVSSSIFGEVRRPTPSKSLRLITMFARRPYEERPEIVDYHPAHDNIDALMTRLREYGLFRNEHLDFKDEMERLRVLRGKSKKRISDD